jgi:glutamate synthase (NADPH/NADH) large chain
MIQIPHEFFFDELLYKGIHLPNAGEYGVGFIFFPSEKAIAAECKEIFERAAEKLNIEIIGYRQVPVNRTTIGNTALSVEPIMEQVFVKKPDHVKDADDFERKLFILKNYASHTINNTIKKGAIDFYMTSFSQNIIVYKGQLTSHQVREYFPDLSDKRVVSAFGLVHSRFATNTFPSWKLAQPFRYIAHNGEINTLQGNLNWLRSNESSFLSP